MTEALPEFTDKDASLSAIFATKNYPEIKKEFIEAITLKESYDSSILEIDKLITSLMLDPEGRSNIYRLKSEYVEIWMKLQEMHSLFSDSLLTHPRFVKKIKERVDNAKKNLSQEDILRADLLLIKIKTLDSQLRAYGLDPIKMMKKEVIAVALKQQYFDALNDLKSKFKDETFTLNQKCPYLFKGI
jgi:hypothetical protein